MIARDLMNSDFPFVTVDADLDYVAKLLNDCGLGAIPVVDAQLSPIGIVTRSNLEEKHDDRLAERILEPVGDHARKRVRIAARAGRHDQPERTIRIYVGGGCMRAQQREGR